MDKISDQISDIAKEKDHILNLLKEHERLLSLKSDLLAKTADQMNSAVYQFSINLDKLLYVNPVLEKWWQQPAEALYENPQLWFQAIHPDDRALVKHALFQLSQSHSKSLVFEFRLMKADSSMSYMQSQCTLVNESYILGTAVDISNYIRAQQRHFIYEQVLSLYNLENSDEIILNSILKVVCQSLNWDEGEIWVHNASDESLYCVSLWHRLGQAITPFYDITYHMVVKVGVGFSDLVIRTNAPVLEHNFSECDHFYRSKMAKIVGLNTALGLPITFHGELIGVLNFFNRKTKTPSAEDLAMLQKIAELIGSIIQKIVRLDNPEASTHHDDLTGLTNRVGFELLLNSCIDNINSDEKLAVVLVDLDKFKTIIETYGEIGDILLKQLSFKFIQALGHDAKTIAHLEKDVYAFIFDNLKKVETLRYYLDNIAVTLQKPFIIKDQNIHIKASMGVSIFPEDGFNSETIIKNADVALKKAKAKGGNYIQLYNETFEKNIADDFNTESALRHALAENQFKLFYQPNVNVKSEKIIGFKAILNWQDPVNGLTSVDSFKTSAEESDLAIFIDEWVLLNISDYFSLGLNLPVSISLSERQFKKSHHILNIINQLIDKFSINPSLLQIEITEKAFLTNTQDVLTILFQLKGRGVTIALNDFGKEFSSFNYLQQLKPSHVTINKSFVEHVPHDAKSVTIVQTMIQFCHVLDIKVVAEEVQTKEQVDFLIKAGCDEMRGPYFSKPLPIYEIKSLLSGKM